MAEKFTSGVSPLVVDSKRQLLSKILTALNGLRTENLYTIPGGGPYVRVQYKHAYPSLGASFTSANTAGNTIVVAVSLSSQNGGSLTSVTDSNGNTYTQISAASYNFTYLSVWVAFGIKAGANAIILTTSDNNPHRYHDDLGFTAVEYSGIGVADIPATSAGGAPPPVTVTAHVTPEMFFVAFADEGGGSNVSGTMVPGSVAGTVISHSDTHVDVQLEWLNSGAGFPAGNYTFTLNVTGAMIPVCIVVPLR